MSDEDYQALAGTYRLLARLWLREVDVELLEQITGPLQDAFTQAGGRVPTTIEGSAEAGVLDSLAADYCQLFVGPKSHLPPVQSVWQQGQFEGDASASMREIMDVLGYSLDHVPTGTMVDHLGVQLDVMAMILTATENVAEAHEIRPYFFRKHLSWTDALLAAAVRKATTDFYRSVIEMTTVFLESEAVATTR